MRSFGCKGCKGAPMISDKRFIYFQAEATAHKINPIHQNTFLLLWYKLELNWQLTSNAFLNEILVTLSHTIYNLLKSLQTCTSICIIISSTCLVSSKNASKGLHISKCWLWRRVTTMSQVLWTKSIKSCSRTWTWLEDGCQVMACDRVHPQNYTKYFFFLST